MSLAIDGNQLLKGFTVGDKIGIKLGAMSGKIGLKIRKNRGGHVIFDETEIEGGHEARKNNLIFRAKIDTVFAVNFLKIFKTVFDRSATLGNTGLLDFGKRKKWSGKQETAQNHRKN